MAELTNLPKDPDLDLDFLDLQTSVARQSSLYSYYSELAVNARAERDTAANTLDIETAKTELNIRADAANRGEKMTESKVSALVESNDHLAELKAELVQKNKELQSLESKVRALDHKKTMIECAVRMVVSKSMGMSMDGVTDNWSDMETTRSIRNGLNGRK